MSQSFTGRAPLQILPGHGESSLAMAVSSSPGLEDHIRNIFSKSLRFAGGLNIDDM
jgi:hypothetical protein